MAKRKARKVRRDVVTVRIWPIGKLPPKGWRVSGGLGPHHGRHSYLIEKVK